MKTKTVYYEEPYKTEIEAVVLEIGESAGSLLGNIILDQTVFFPEGGGQPGDRGEIVGKNGLAKVEYTRVSNGEIVHQGKIIDSLAANDKVLAKIDWNWRYRYMKIHSAGHLVHDVLMSMVRDLTPLRGNHGKKASLEYEGTIDIAIKEELEKKVNEVAGLDLPIITKEATYEELAKECQFVPPSLPRDKALRMLKIGEFSAMPDGGVHVKSTKEIGKIVINNLASQNGIVIVDYRVFGSE